MVRPLTGALKRVQFRSRRNCPVRPAVESVLGEKAYAALREVPDKFDLVDVFRAPKYVGEIVEKCIALGVPSIWLQEGVVNIPAAERAREAGMTVVMDRCVYREYLRLFGPVPHP